jgi:hypothetical protein
MKVRWKYPWISLLCMAATPLVWFRLGRLQEAQPDQVHWLLVALIALVTGIPAGRFVTVWRRLRAYEILATQELFTAAEIGGYCRPLPKGNRPWERPE